LKDIPFRLVRQGWTKDTVRQGDHLMLVVIIATHQALRIDGTHRVPGGKTMYQEQAPVVSGTVAPKINPSTDFRQLALLLPGHPKKFAHPQGRRRPSTDGPTHPRPSRRSNI
jgi:hypothetical protein